MENKALLQIIVIAVLIGLCLFYAFSTGILVNVVTLMLGILLGFVLIPALLRKLGVEI